MTNYALINNVKTYTLTITKNHYSQSFGASFLWLPDIRPKI